MNVWTRLKLAEGASPAHAEEADAVNPLTCQAAVHAVSDQLAGLRPTCPSAVANADDHSR